MADLPIGTVTFLFTDIEGSTRLLAGLGERYQALLSDHNRLLRAAFTAHGGCEVDHEGDGFFAAFPSARQAVAAAVEAQRALAAHPWPNGAPVRVRMGLHTGEADLLEGSYVGMDVHRAARIGAAAHGGQTIVSDDTRRLVEGALPPGVGLTDLGHHRLKDLPRDEHLHQVNVEGLPASFPPPRGLPARGNLPAVPTSFVGRRDELVAVEEALARPDVRLLTLTGAGGSGKTRLALEAAARARHRFEGGTSFVALAHVRDPEVVASTVAEALGLREVGQRRALQLVEDHLRDRHALLVLDNLEQVQGAGPLLARLLAVAPRLRLLVTSRSALHVYGEHEMPVRPLALPEPGAGAGAVAASEAVELFVQRARAVVPAFTVTAANAPAVAEVVARIDGLPLAIELAASRVRLLSPQELAGRLGSRLRVLTGGAGDLPDRQRTLRATIDWSYQLLDAPEQATFRRLGVFVGGCTLESAAAVVDPDGALPLDMLDAIASLLDKSLLVSREGSGGTTRFHMLETLREYAREQLEAHGETEGVARRHAFHHLAWAERAREALDAGDAAQLDAFDTEHANLGAALAWAVGTGEPDGAEAALRLVAATAWYWYTRGHTLVAARWLERALQRGGDAPPLLRAKPLYWLGAIHDRRGDLERARAAMAASVAAWREADVPAKLATALNGLATVAENQGDLAVAEATYEESLAGYRAVGDEHGVATVLSGLGTTAMARGDPGEAARLLGESLRLFTAAGDAWSIAVVESSLAWVQLERDRAPEAAALALDATRRFRDWGEQSYLAACLELHAALAARAEPSRARDAAHLLGAAHALRETTGASLSERARVRVDRHTAPARRALDDGTVFDEAFTAGAAAPLVEVLDRVLSGVPDPPRTEPGAE